MKFKKIVLFVILAASLFFVGSMIIATNKFANKAHSSADRYLSKKKFLIAGKILSSEKVSGKNKLVELEPSLLSNELLDKENSIGFYTKDTSKVFLIVNFPKTLIDADSLSSNAQKTTFYKNKSIIGETAPELMRWQKVQDVKLNLEKNKQLDLEYLY